MAGAPRGRGRLTDGIARRGLADPRVAPDALMGRVLGPLLARSRARQEATSTCTRPPPWVCGSSQPAGPSARSPSKLKFLACGVDVPSGGRRGPCGSIVRVVGWSAVSLDKGKPVVRRGRKATRPRVRLVELPKEGVYGGLRPRVVLGYL